MSSAPSVLVRKEGSITWVGIDRHARRNAVDRHTAEQLADAFRAFDADATASVAILHGVGGTFCAGADLKAIHEGGGNRLDASGDGPMGPSRMRLSKPVIAAIDGHAVAGGLELALWCDLRVVEETATLGVFCRRWGVPLIDGGTARLPALIGLSRALDLILTGRAVSADEAHAIGLANRVVPAGESHQAALALAQQLAAFPQACLRSDRAAAYDGIGVSLDQALAQEFAHGQVALREMGEGVARFADGAGRGGRFDES